MRCHKCHSHASLWKPAPETHHEYRVECRECHSFIKWGTSDQLRQDLALGKGSELQADLGDQSIDVSDLFQ